MAAVEKHTQHFLSSSLTQKQQDNQLLQEATQLQPVSGVTSTYLDGQQDFSDMAKFTAENQQLLAPIGITPGKKGEGITRIMYENLNGLPARVSGNKKLQKLMGNIDHLEVDLFACNEHKINSVHKDNKRCALGRLFDGGEVLSRTIGGNFKHPIARSMGKRIEGGTGMVAYGELASLLRTELSGMDETGLARWTYMSFSGKEGHLTTVLVGYNPCKSTKSYGQSSYQLQRAYFTVAKQDTTCPRKKFEEDLVQLLISWRQAGRRLIVCLDANDHIYTGKLAKALTGSPQLDLFESTLATTGSRLTATYFRGSRPIDAIWTTPDVSVTNVCAMPIGFGVGDHRAFVMDITTNSMVGSNPQPIKRPTARRLNTRIPGCAEAYNSILESQVSRHCIIDRLNAVHQQGGPPEVIRRKLDAIDKTMAQLMHHAEKQCRRLKSGRIPFSPEASMWIKRTLCYRALLRFWAGKIKNRGNLRRQAKRCHIENPFSLSLQSIADRLAQCRARCQYFMKYGQRHRKQHLTARLHAAKDRQDEEGERRILQIIKGERDRAFWRRLNWALGQRRGSSVNSVQVSREDGTVEDFTTQSAVQDTIWETIHRERYHLAEEAPICQGRLRGEFGYNANTSNGEAVLEGTYEASEDMHIGTQLLFQSIAALREIVPPNSIKQIITREEWQWAWKRKQEKTSSSQSGLHFGHYIAGANSDILSDIHALKTSLALHYGVALTRWKSGLCVMLEKQPGVRLISKLRAILLMEADFNAANKILFGNRMLQQIRRYKLMPEEIFSERQRMAEDGIMAKVLFYDISRQLRAPAALASVDAANCYDRVAHAIASLVFRAFGSPLHMTLSMLTAIQQMQFFLRTAFGDSNRAVGSRLHLRTQGFMQGNGASPAGWTAITIVILHAHKQKGHGATFVCPITKTQKDLSCILYVDDNDLLHMCEEETDTIHTAHEAIQDSITSWGELLIATGGALKPPKCFFYLVGYEWDADGNWKYQTGKHLAELTVSVPLPDGSTAPIQHHSVHTPSVTLGGQTSPSGQDALSYISEKALDWAFKARNSNLKPRDFHTSVQRKFWPKIRYGLCAITDPLDNLISAMHRPYYWMAPIGGMLRSAKREIRHLDTGFYGLGFPHWGIEALVEAYKKFFVHYGTTTIVGIQLQVAVENLIIELGVSSQPFLLPFQQYSPRATTGFCTSLWEKLDRYHLPMRLGKDVIAPPREHDQWLMTSFEHAGYSLEDCKTLNKVRLHQQVLFDSDIYNADGNTINPKYLQPRETGERWSTLRFGRQQPSHTAFQLWREAIGHLTPNGRRRQKLGDFISHTHTIWTWRYDPTREIMFHTSNQQTRKYVKQNSVRRARHSIFTLQGPTAEDTSQTYLCSADESRADAIVLKSYIKYTPRNEKFTHFLDILKSWQYPRIWKGLKFTGDGTWIYDAIKDGTLIGVSDGSFLRELHPNVCSAAIMFECTQGRGQLSLSFSDRSPYANAFRGELLGLMAIYLILHSISELLPTLTGQVDIFSDCMGALQTLSNLPPSRIPPKWKHADILKIISLHGQHIPFHRRFFHVKAHQDDTSDWSTLTRPAQLNCACDVAAKREIIENSTDTPAYPQLPSEVLSIVVDHHKLTSDTDSILRYTSHKAEARTLFISQRILTADQFDEIAWQVTHSTLHKLPKMFQLFACKQVFGISAVLGNLAKQKAFSHLGTACPSCTICKETTAHLLQCREEGRMRCVHQQLLLVQNWLYQIGTNPHLAGVISQFLFTRGEANPHDYSYQHRQYIPFLQSQASIGWTRTMEGMISAELLLLSQQDILEDNCKLTVEAWAQQFVQKLLEATHGVWIYRNIIMHDSTAGLIATKGKEQLLQEIEAQMELGGEGLEEQDKWMLEVNLPAMDQSTGEKESYWLLAIRTARERHHLMRNSRT